MIDPLHDVPLRQLTRLRIELSMGVAGLTAGLFPDQPMLGIEFGTVARMSLADWRCGGSLARPAAPTRTMTIRQIASSVTIAPETTRRHVHQLCDRGALAVSAKGVWLAETAENEELALRYFLGIHDFFVRLIEDMALTCDIALPIASMPSFGAVEVVERALDTLFLPIDTFRPVKHREAALLWGALNAVAARDVTYDPVLSRRYADEIIPDTMRIGVSLRRCADAIAIPYATAWRLMQGLHADGLVTRVGTDQWAVLTQNLMQERVQDLGTTPSVLLLRKVRELALLGLDPGHAADHYRLGRPALANLGLS